MCGLNQRRKKSNEDQDLISSSTKMQLGKQMSLDLQSLTALKEPDYGNQDIFGGGQYCNILQIQHLTVKIRCQPEESLDSEA